MAAQNTAQLAITAEDRTKAAFDSVARNFSNLNRTAEAAKRLFAGGIIGAAFTAGLREVGAATITLERSQNQLAATLKATGFAAGLTTADLEDLAGALSKSTAFDDDDIRQAEVALLRFRDVQGDVFRDAIKASLDLASAQGTTAAEGARSLGRALENPETGLRTLREVGVSLTDTQKDLIRGFEETGNKAASARIILDELAAHIGGQAAGENVGLYGSTRALAKAWDDLLKSIGSSAAFQGGVGFLAQTLKETQSSIDQFGRADTAAQKLTATLRALAGAFPGNAELRQRLAIPEVVEPTSAAERGERAKAEAGAAANDRRLREEAARAAADRALRSRVAIVTAALQKETAATQEAAATNERLLEIYYDRGLVRTADFYLGRLRIQKQANESEIAGIDRVISAQRQLLGAPSTTADQRPGIQAEIARLEAQRDNLSERNRMGLMLTSEQLTDALQKEDDHLKEINATLLEQRGLLEQATALRQSVENRVFRAQVAQDRPQDLALLNQQEEAARNQARLNELIRDAGILRDQQSNKEQAVLDQLAQGHVTEFGALVKIDAIRRDSVETLRKTADEQERVARAIGDPQAIQNAKNLQQAIDDIAAASTQVADKFRGVFSDSLTAPLADFITGTRSAKDALSDFARNVEQAFARIAAQNIAESIFGASGAGGGIAPFLAQIFGGGWGGLAKGGILTSHGIQSFASGGIARSPGLAMVGEGGMSEAVVPLPNGRSIPVAWRGGGGGRGGHAARPVNLTMNVYTQDAASFKRSQRQILNDLHRQLRAG